METVVLPAQDHLAQERYIHQSRVMSGMIYPLGGLPRTRRKVKSPPQVFAAASLHSEPARISSNKHVHAAEAKSGVVSPMDMSMGVLRSAPSSASTPPHPPTAALTTPQYRLHNTAVYGSIAHESTSPPLKHQLTASFSTPVVNGATASPVLRTRSDGELLQGLRKGAEVEKTFERRRAYEKAAESMRNSFERKSAEKTLDKAEKSFDRRKGSERRAVDKKAAVISSNQGDKSSNVQRKVGVITILQRPQTKEAAMENMAKITGRPIEVVTMQMLKSADNFSQPHDQVEMKAAPVVASSVEDVRGVEALSKDAEFDSGHPGNASSISPKKVGKKKASREHPGKSGSRLTSEIVHATGRSIKDAEKHRGLDWEVRKIDERKRDSSPVTVRSTKDAEKHRGLDWEVRKGDERKRESSPVSPSSVGGSVSNLTNQGVSSFSPTGNLLRGPSDAGEISQFLVEGRHGGVSRSGSFREVPHAGGDSVELLFVPSSPPKNSERWAGPAYTNSPPPSTLPLPKFPIQRVKSSLTSVTLAGVVPLEENTPTKSSSAPSSPTRVASLFFSASGVQSVFVDPLSATKDLRRMLNLDVEVADEGVASILKAKDILRDSATQSLKRILQLN